jgi:hypothetical protein
LTLEDYHARMQRLPHANIEFEEVLALREFLYYLAFDYVQYGHDHDTFAQDIRVPDDHFFKLICHENEGLVAKRRKESVGLAMPAKRFIRLYLGDHDMPGDLRSQNSAQRQWKGRVLQEFREKFHK